MHFKQPNKTLSSIFKVLFKHFGKAVENTASATNIAHLLKLKTKQVLTINAESYHWMTKSTSFFFKLH